MYRETSSTWNQTKKEQTKRNLFCGVEEGRKWVGARERERRVYLYLSRSTQEGAEKNKQKLASLWVQKTKENKTKPLHILNPLSLSPSLSVCLSLSLLHSPTCVFLQTCVNWSVTAIEHAISLQYAGKNS